MCKSESYSEMVEKISQCLPFDSISCGSAQKTQKRRAFVRRTNGVTTEYNRSTTAGCNESGPAGTRHNMDSRTSGSVTRIPIRTPKASKATPADQPTQSILLSQADFQLRGGRLTRSPTPLIFAANISLPISRTFLDGWLPL